MQCITEKMYVVSTYVVSAHVVSMYVVSMYVVSAHAQSGVKQSVCLSVSLVPRPYPLAWKRVW